MKGFELLSLCKEIATGGKSISPPFCDQCADGNHLFVVPAIVLYIYNALTHQHPLPVDLGMKLMVDFSM